jgi:2-hydroxychromene-2-carboxylate isomerase
MMPPPLDFWFDFASTYSYPVVMRIAPLAQQAGVMVRFRPFLLGPLFKAPGLAYLSVQYLSRKGAQYVAGPRWRVPQFFGSRGRPNLRLVKKDD